MRLRLLTCLLTYHSSTQPTNQPTPLAGFTTTAHDDASATLLCLVNPTNPTGDYLTVEAMKSYIEANAQPGMF